VTVLQDQSLDRGIHSTECHSNYLKLINKLFVEIAACYALLYRQVLEKFCETFLMFFAMTFLLQTSCCRCFCVTLTRLPATDRQLPALHWGRSLTTITRYRQPRPLFTFANKVMFTSAFFVCLFVCLLAGLHKN